MGKNYELKRVDDEVWELTSPKIQEKKTRFGILQHYIKVRKKRIERLKKKIKELQLERIEWEKERGNLYDNLSSFQNNYIPSVNPTTQVGNNYQWSINLKIGGLKRKVYLGSNTKVRTRLDEIKDLELFLPKINNIKDDLTEECREEIRKIIQKNLVKEMEKDYQGVYNRWEKNQLKMWDYFY
jgi:hypothetical protein